MKLHLPGVDHQRWLGNMKKLRTWGAVNEALYGFATAVKDVQFVAI